MKSTLRLRSLTATTHRHTTRNHAKNHTFIVMDIMMVTTVQTTEGIIIRIVKAGGAQSGLQSVWQSRSIFRNTKLQNFKHICSPCYCVATKLEYRMKEKPLKVQILINKCLRRIMRDG